MTEIAISCKPIGVIRSDHLFEEQTPVQPPCASGLRGRVEIFPQYTEGLRDLEGFSHVYLICHFHTARNGWQDEVSEETAGRRGRRGYSG